MNNPNILDRRLKQLKAEAADQGRDNKEDFRARKTAHSQSTKLLIAASGNILHSNTLTRALCKRNQVLFQPLPLGRVDPALWFEGVGVREDRLVMVH